MKKTILVLLLAFTLCGTTLFAESFRIGFQGGVEMLERPQYESIVREFDDRANLVPGFYWEVIPRNLGFGMTSQI